MTQQITYRVFSKEIVDGRVLIFLWMSLVLPGKRERTLTSDNMGLSYIPFDALTLRAQQSSERMSTFAAEMWSLEQHHQRHLRFVKMQFLIQ